MSENKKSIYYVNDYDAGFTRKRHGRGFIYLSLSNKKIKSDKIIKRIKSLTIPPAWNDVWICKNSRGHIQATGIDGNGKKQYIYHPAWVASQQQQKYDALKHFDTYLPKIRRCVEKDLNLKLLSKKQIIAAIIRVIDKSHIRVGKHSYTQKNGTRGATTLSKKNVSVTGNKIKLTFVGKSQVKRLVSFEDNKLAKILQHCQELDNQYLFSYLDERNEVHNITSSDINNYLFECCQFKFTAKDFRTWWANVHYLESIVNLSKNTLEKPLKKWIADSIKYAASELGHTISICKKNYLHPTVISACEKNIIYAILKKLPKKIMRKRRYISIEELRFHYVVTRIDKDELKV